MLFTAFCKISRSKLWFFLNCKFILSEINLLFFLDKPTTQRKIYDYRNLIICLITRRVEIIRNNNDTELTIDNNLFMRIITVKSADFAAQSNNLFKNVITILQMNENNRHQLRKESKNTTNIWLKQ